MSEKNSKLIRDYCYYHGVHENKIFKSRKVRARFVSLNRKGRKIAIEKMLSDLVRWKVPKYLEINKKLVGELNVF